MINKNKNNKIIKNKNKKINNKIIKIKKIKIYK